MRTPEEADVLTVVRIECVAKGKVKHRLEWGFRWVYEKWRISQRYSVQDRRGAHTYRWNDIFDVLIGGKKLAYSTSLMWVYARADRVVDGDSQWSRGEFEEPWRYTKGKEERDGGKEWGEVLGDGGEVKRERMEL